MLKIKHKDMKNNYLKNILNILTEAYDYVKLTEAVPYSKAKEYLQIERSPEAETRIKQVFSKLKSLPNARQLDKRGWRIAFPYAEDSTEFEIQSILEPYDFSIKNYKDGVALDTKSNKEIAIGKALNKISKKEPDAKELLDRYAAIKGKGATNKDEDLMIVFSSAKYDIIGMSTDRDSYWDSCMNVIKGSNRHYVKLDLKEGSIICYLTTISDTNLKKPLGRVLIKPYINTENKEDVVLYAELKTYGKISNSEKFMDEVDDYMEKTQKLSGSYERLGCLYPDSDRDTIEGKETIRTRALKKFENGEELEDSEFVSLPLEIKRKSIDDFIKNNLELDGFIFPIKYSYASQSQKKNIIKIHIKNKMRIYPFLFNGAPKDSKKEIIDYKLDNRIELEDSEYRAATPEQRGKHLDNKIENENFLYNNELKLATEEQREKYYNVVIRNGKRLNKYSFEYMSQNLKEKYIDSIIYNTLEDYELDIATEKQKEKHYNIIIERGYRIIESYFKYMPQNLKEKYIDGLIDSNERLKDYELRIATPKQQIKYVKLILRNDSLYDSEIELLSNEARTEYLNIKSESYWGLSSTDFKYMTDEQIEKYINLKLDDFFFKSLQSHEYDAATKEQKEKYIISKIENNKNLFDYELDLATPEQKEKYIDIKLKNGYKLQKYEFEYATKEQKEKYINWIIRNYSVKYDMILSYDMFKDATPEQKEKYIEKKINNKEQLNSFEYIEATLEQKERYQEYDKD
jgi:hypothetical protein